MACFLSKCLRVIFCAQFYQMASGSYNLKGGIMVQQKEPLDLVSAVISVG